MSPDLILARTWSDCVLVNLVQCLLQVYEVSCGVVVMETYDTGIAEQMQVDGDGDSASIGKGKNSTTLQVGCPAPPTCKTKSEKLKNCLIYVIQKLVLFYNAKIGQVLYLYLKTILTICQVLYLLFK